ncbi:MAG: hypothetical protein IKZ60_07810 [Bacteroidales bacterium]|nr:hypothetical protein [Bacteroidales bacterium]
MKKLFAIVLAVLPMVAACQKEVFAPDTSKVRTFTATYDPIAKTALDDLTPVWRAGDQIWICDGLHYEVVSVKAADDGKTTATFTTTQLDAGMVYAVYPASAAAGYVRDGKVGVQIPTHTDGSFANANICIAETSGNTLALRNAASIIKFTKSTADVAKVSISVSSFLYQLAGLYDVQYSDLSYYEPDYRQAKSVSVDLEGVGPWYVAIHPVTMTTGSFIFTKSDGTRAARTTANPNTFYINKIKTISLDDAIAGLSFESPGSEWLGSGVDGDPYLIANAQDLDLLASTVNSGNSLGGKYFKVVADFTTSDNYTPIGRNGYMFAGRQFDGDYHTITLSGSFNTANGRVGIFGQTGNSANDIEILNLNVAGTVNLNDNNVQYYGAVCAYTSTRTKLVRCTSSVNATVSSSDFVSAGGVAGYAYCSGSGKTTLLSECVNYGNLSFNSTYAGANYFAGVCGKTSYSSNGKISFAKCGNLGNVTGTADNNSGYAYVAGILGSTKNDNSYIAGMFNYNWGDVVAKATGGNDRAIACGITYFSPVSYSYNAGSAKAYYGASYENEGTYASGIGHHTGGTITSCYSLLGAVPVLQTGSGATYNFCNTFEKVEGIWKVTDSSYTLLNRLNSNQQGFIEGNVAPDYFPVTKIYLN